jgi:hypothetical protein
VVGGSRRSDRSVSMYDVRHVFNTTAAYDLPVGRGRHFLSRTGKPLDAVLGGWTITSLFRRNSGFPAWVTLVDGNQLTDVTHTIRPNVVAGEPIVNPLYSRSCPQREHLSALLESGCV